MVSNRSALLLTTPAVLLFTLLLVGPLGFLVGVSLLPSAPAAELSGAMSLATYGELGDPYIVGIMLRTLRIAGLTTAFCLVLGYPLAISVARARGLSRTLQMVLVISPLFVSVVVRAYGWILVLGNRGLVNSALVWLGVLDEPARLLNTEAAVIIGLVEALLPFMVLSLAAVLERQDPALEEAARGLGDSAFGTFVRVTLPMSRSGALAGSLLVFMVSMGSFATPALLGGSQVRLMVTEIYTQVTSVFNWPLGAALSIALLAVSLAVIAAASRFGGGRRVSSTV